MDNPKDCDLCAKDSGLLDFSRVCCRVRFLLKQPLLEVRRAWLDRWRSKDGDAVTDQIAAALAERWRKR